MGDSWKKSVILCRITAVFLLFVSLLTACTSLTALPNNTATPTSTSLPVSNNLITPLPTVNIEATPIAFSPDAETINVQDEIDGEKSLAYVFWANAAQTILINTKTLDNGLNFSLIDAYGRLLASLLGDDSTSVTLPESGFYYFRVFVPAGNGRSSFTFGIQLFAAGGLPVNIAPFVAAGTPLAAETIHINPDADSETISAQIAPHERKWYQISATRGQTLVVFPNPGSHQLDVQVKGEDGTLLGHATRYDLLTAVIPTTQIYDLFVTTNATDGKVPYNLTVTLIDQAAPSPETETGDERISFSDNSPTTHVSGTLTSGGSKTYLVYAQAGQTMTIDALPSGSEMTITVHGADGTLLGWVPAGTQFSETLPRTQNYFIDLVAPENSNSLDYTLTVTIQ